MEISTNQYLVSIHLHFVAICQQGPPTAPSPVTLQFVRIELFSTDSALVLKNDNFNFNYSFLAGSLLSIFYNVWIAFSIGLLLGMKIGEINFIICKLEICFASSFHYCDMSSARQSWDRIIRYKIYEAVLSNGNAKSIYPDFRKRYNFISMPVYPFS